MGTFENFENSNSNKIMQEKKLGSLAKENKNSLSNTSILKKDGNQTIESETHVNKSVNWKDSSN
jgi:hypothetical protein